MSTESPTPHEEGAQMDAHFEIPEDKPPRRELSCWLGPCLDQTFGVVVFERPESEAAARAFVLMTRR